MLKNDRWICEQARRGMIEPFCPELVRAVESRPVLSYGLSSYGYDIRLSPVEFKIFRHVPGTVVDPKRFNPKNLEAVELHHDEMGDYFIIPAHSYGLGVSLERLRPEGGTYASVRAAMPGSTLPSNSSRLAPPPVEIWVILSARPTFSTAATESPPPMMVVAPA